MPRWPANHLPASRSDVDTRLVRVNDTSTATRVLRRSATYVVPLYVLDTIFVLEAGPHGITAEDRKWIDQQSLRCAHGSKETPIGLENVKHDRFLPSVIDSIARGRLHAP